MTEFVFLPHRNADKDAAITEMVAAVAETSNVEMAPAHAGPPGKLLSSAMEAVERLSSRTTTKSTIQIIDTIESTGATLVAMPSGQEIQAVGSGSMHPVLNYTPAISDVRVGRSKMHLLSGPAASGFLKIKLQFAGDGTPVKNAVANLRLVGGQDINAVSDHNGIVTFGIRAASINRARLIVETGFEGHWGYLDSNVSIASGDVFEIQKIDLTNTPDALRHMIPPGNNADGVGVKVAVIDTGVGPHEDLRNASGDHDSSLGHGTHVAGIIGGQGGPILGGVAPGVEIVSYRVFNDPSTGVARNFEIHGAIEQAVEDGCHLVNLSLKSEYPQLPAYNDPVISRAVEDAANAGVLCIAAAGNDFGRFVSFPARHEDVLAISAVGWEPGLPSSALDRWTVTGKRGAPDADIYFAKFSNEGIDGTRVDVTGPGAGVVSTVPGDAYAPMSGTSMACPAITGAVAKRLAEEGAVLQLPGNRLRTEKMLDLIRADLQSLGLAQTREGDGTLD